MVKPWNKLGSTLAHHTRILDVLNEPHVSPRTGKTFDCVVVDCANWVNVIAVTRDAQVVMIRQFRFGSGEVTLEIPGGIIDPGESPLQAAQRELREECGYTAGRWTPLGFTHPNPAFQRNTLHAFLAEDAVLQGAQELDAMEDIEVSLVPLSDIDARIAAGELTHALVTFAFHRLDLLRRGHSFA